jgi:hypothetical protein
VNCSHLDARALLRIKLDNELFDCGRSSSISCLACLTNVLKQHFPSILFLNLLFKDTICHGRATSQQRTAAGSRHRRPTWSEFTLLVSVISLLAPVIMPHMSFFFADEPSEQMQQLRLLHQSRGFSAPPSAPVSSSLPNFQSIEMRVPSGSPHAVLAMSPTHQQHEFGRQPWPRSLGEVLVADEEVSHHEGTLGATLREFLQPQVDTWLPHSAVLLYGAIFS